MPVTYRLEADMLQPVVDYFQKMFPDYQHVTELWYIDLVFFKIDDALLEKRKRSAIMCDPGRLHFLSYFKQEWLTIKESASHYSANATRLNANLLHREGFLLPPDRDGLGV